MAARPGKKLNHAEELFNELPAGGHHHSEHVFKALCAAKGVPAEKVRERWASVFKVARRLASEIAEHVKKAGKD